MFWPFLAASAVGVAFIKLGALSVWVTVMSQALTFLICLCIAIAVWSLWKQYGA